MKDSSYTYRDLLWAGWEKTREYFWILLVGEIVYAAVSALASPVPLIGFGASMLLSMAAAAMSLHLARGKSAHYEDYMAPLKSFDAVWNFMVTLILYAVIVVVGLLFLVLPGIYLGVRLHMAFFSVIDDYTIDPVDALKKSWHMTRGQFWRVFGFMLLSVLLLIISIVPFGLGLIFSFPLVYIAYAYLYRTLLGETVAFPRSGKKADEEV